MTARFWWWLRCLWHRPHLSRLVAYERFYFSLSEYGYPWRYLLRNPRMWRHDLRIIPSRISRRLLIIWSHGPLACNGDDGGWRTSVCEWLEARARAAEGWEL